MKFKKPQQEVEIPTASMADIAFLLIVFFMVTTVFAETMGLNFAVPPREEDQEEQSSESEEAVHVKIDPTGAVTIDDEPVSLARAGEDLGAYLLPKLERWPEKPILVTSDPASPYGAFVEIYDGLRQVEKEAQERAYLPPGKSLKVSIPSLSEIAALKAQFGEDIFQ